MASFTTDFVGFERLNVSGDEVEGRAGTKGGEGGRDVVKTSTLGGGGGGVMFSPTFPRILTK